jgi:hypothetical protein
MVLYNSEWVWQRVKRFVPPPETLAPRVLEVIQKFGPLQDAVTGQPLFNNTSWEAARTVLENIQQGYYSDPPGFQLYSTRGEDTDGLTLYRCVRGTNNVEGGVHRNIIKRFGSYNASARFSTNLLRDYNVCRNLKVCQYRDVAAVVCALTELHRQGWALQPDPRTISGFV